MATKTIYVSVATGKEVSERFRKANPDKVIRKRVKVVEEVVAPKAKKVAAAPVSYTYISLTTGKEVSERFAKANPSKVRRKKVVAAKVASAKKVAKKPVSKPTTPKGAVKAAKVPTCNGGNILVEPPVMVNGLESKNSYLIVARRGGSSLGFRYFNGKVRIHAYPSFDAMGLKFSHPITRDAGRCDTAPYETSWESPSTAKLVLNDLKTISGAVSRTVEDVVKLLNLP